MQIVNEGLVERVREIGRATTPEELSQRGVRRLRSVGMKEVSKLIEMAVNRTLMERTIGASEREIGDLTQRAQGTLIELIHSHQELARSRGELERTRVELARELAQLKDRRSVAGEPGSYEHDERAFAEALSAELEPLLGPLGPAAVGEVADRAFRALVAARREATAVRDRRIDLLERRITKLSQSLETTEGALQQLALRKNVDLGVASLYRVVQGLSPVEPELQAKQQMMARLFEANLALQGKVAV
jgi:hypothetical protein